MSLDQRLTTRSTHTPTRDDERRSVVAATVLGTDADGAAALRADGGDAWMRAIAEHHGEPWGVVDARGHDRADEVIATFSSARGCVLAASAIQRHLAERAGAATHVAMGICTCEGMGASSVPTRHDVRRATRIAEVAHAGEILVGASTAAVLDGVLPDGHSLRALGEHRLRDLEGPESLFRLVAPGMRAVLAPPRSLDSAEFPNNLPSSLSPFVGRIDELAEVVGLLRDARLVTLTGAGGSGKTRLALQAAAEVLDDADEGVWLVELATLVDPNAVPAAIADAIELTVEADRPAHEALVASLRDQSILLVLDNCEHLLDAVTKVVDAIVSECPKVSLLATSREPLGAEGERVYRVRSLSLPPEGTADANELADSDAVQLFVTRAAGRDPQFSLDDATALLAGSVCRRLDGIPLAIELAAARQSSMPLADLSARLDERFRLLTGGSCHALPRQQTLDAVVGWSYDMLTEPERSVLRRLSVFIDGFDLGGAQMVCETAGLGTADVAAVVDSLVDKSLVGAERVAGTMWYSLLEVIRHFAAEQLLDVDGEATVTEVRRRHARYHLELCEQAGEHLQYGGDAQVDWVHLLDRQWGNIQRTLAFYEWEPDGLDGIVRLVWGFGFYDLTRGHRQPYAALQSALARTDDASAQLRCRALITWAMRATNLDSDLPSVIEAGRAAAIEALALARSLDDRLLTVMAMVEEARALQLLERREEALAVVCRCISLARGHVPPSLLGRALDILATVEPDAALALAHRHEAIECFRAGGDRIMECTELMLLAINGWQDTADVARGIAALTDALELAEQLGSPGQLAYLWANLAIASSILDEFDQAEMYCRRNLRAVRRLGMTQGFVTFDMLIMSRCSAHRGDVATAAMLAGASEAFWSSVARPTEFTLTPMELDLISRHHAELSAALGGEAFDRLFEAGRQLTVDRAVDLALGRVESPA